MADAACCQSMQHGRVWTTGGGEHAFTGHEAEHVVRRSLAAGQLDITLHAEDTRLQFVTNGERVMLLLWGPIGSDEGVFAVDPDASGRAQGGYRLANGQVDTYSDEETVPLAAGMKALRYIVDNHVRDPHLRWRSWT